MTTYHRFMIDGLGESGGGDALVSLDPFILNRSNVYYVSSVIGSDATANGSDRAHPYATLGAALSATASGDIVVLMPGHMETVAAAADLGIYSTNLTIVGAGTGTYQPKITIGKDYSISIGVNGCTVRNVAFQASLADRTTEAITASAQGAEPTSFIGCTFNLGAHDIAATGYLFLPYNPGNSLIGVLEFSDCSFVSTSVGASPTAGLFAEASALSLVTMDSCTLDGGTVGWASYAIDLASGSSSVVKASRMLHVRGSDAFLDNGAYGFWQMASGSTGGGQAIWGAR